MKESGLRAIEIVGSGPYDKDDYGATDLLVFVDGKFLVPNIHYTFDGSKLEFKNKPRTDVIIYSRTTGSFRIVRGNLGANSINANVSETVPDDDVEFTASAGGYGPKEDSVPTPELSEQEVDDISIALTGRETEPKEASYGP